MTEGGWEQFEVEADVGIHGWGPSRAVAVAQLTLGVFSLIAAPGSVEVRERREVRAQAEGPEALLVTWVDECLYVHEIEGFVVHEVEMPRPLPECLGTAADLALCLWEGGGQPLGTTLAGAGAPRSAVVLVGPEGGLAIAEVGAAKAAGSIVVSLGRRILRTETAGPAIVAILQSRLGDLR